MKKSILSLCFALVSASAMALSWDAPTPQLTTTSIPDKAVLVNVESGAYLYKGASWGTSSAITTDFNTAYVYEIISSQTYEGAYEFYCSDAAQTGYLGRNGNLTLYTDTRSGNYNANGWSTFFEFEATTGGYIIRSAANCPIWGTSGTAGAYTDDDDVAYALYQMGHDPSLDAPDDKNGEGTLGTYEGVYMFSPSSTTAGMTWAFVSGDDIALFGYQTTLYTKLDAALEVGYDEAILEPYAAYLTTGDTTDVKTAIAAVEDLILNTAYAQATVDDPYELTDLVLTNPTMEGSKGATVSGWTTTSNVTIQNNHNYEIWQWDDEDHTTGDYVASTYGLYNFAQAWVSSGCLDDTDIQQTISDLPQGTYIFQADVIATSNSTSYTVSGAVLYAESGVLVYETEVMEGYENNQTYGTDSYNHPETYTVNIIHLGGDLTVGYKYTPGYVSWFAMDNARLFYAGKVDNVGVMALKSTMATMQAYLDGYADGTYIYSAETYEALMAEMQNAETIYDAADDDACSEESAVLYTYVTSIKNEITAYASLKSLIEEITADATTYASLSDLKDLLDGLLDDYYEAYEDKEASVEDIEGYIAAYSTFVYDYVKEHMSEATASNPIDITVLAENMDYSGNTSDGWTISYDSSASQSVSYTTAEVWNGTFSCLQSLDNMPAGKYVLKANAFYRAEGNSGTYSGYVAGTNEILTKLCIGLSTAEVVDQAAGAIEADEAPYTGYAETSDGSGIYVPNSMQAASLIFADEEANPYGCEVSGYLAEDGTLTFGIRNDGDEDGETLDDCWSIWSNFQLFYYGEDAEALLSLLDVYLAEAKALVDEAALNVAASDKLDAAITQGEAVSDGDSNETITAAVAALSEAIDYVNASTELISEVISAYESYTAKVIEAEGDGTSELEQTLQTVGAAITNEDFESNETMEQWLSDLEEQWAAFVMRNAESATIDAPVDFTGLIVNPNFDEGTNDTAGATGWTIDYTASSSSGHIGYGSTSQQSASDYAYEFWYVDAFKMTQKISGLPEGYYTVQCNAMYRHGGSSQTDYASWGADAEGQSLMQLIANTKATRVQNVYDGLSNEISSSETLSSITVGDETLYCPNTMTAFYDYCQAGQYVNTVDVYVSEGDDLTIGLLLDGTPASAAWCVFDNFKLFYLGAGEENCPEAIEAVEATTATSAIYDLSGRQVKSAQKGIYIVGGKKVVVK